VPTYFHFYKLVILIVKLDGCELGQLVGWGTSDWTHDSVVIELSRPLRVQKLEVDSLVWSYKVVLW